MGQIIKERPTRIFCSYKSDKGFWFRVFGYGLNFTQSWRPMLFSERNGYKKYITLFGWRITWLRKN